MELTSNLKEFTAESKVTWIIKNLTQVDWKKNYCIKSKEIHFKEANIRWFLKLTPFLYPPNGVYLMSKFYVKHIDCDENAKYKFDITLKDGTVVKSKIMTMNKNNSKSFEHEISKYISTEEKDIIELTPRIVFETLRDDAGTCEDNFEGLVQAAESRNESSCDSCDVETSSSDDDIEKPIFMMSDLELSEKISEVYLSKMRQVAETSGKLLVSAARGDIKNLLADCVTSFAAQITTKNFTDIWEIANKLNVQALKDKVVQFVITNRDKLTYDQKMTPELMLNVVKAMD